MIGLVALPRCQYRIERYLIQIVPLRDQTAFQSFQRIVLALKDLGGRFQLGIVQPDQHLIGLDPVALLDQQGLDRTAFAVLHGQPVVLDFDRALGDDRAVQLKGRCPSPQPAEEQQEG